MVPRFVRPITERLPDEGQRRHQRYPRGSRRWGWCYHRWKSKSTGNPNDRGFDDAIDFHQQENVLTSTAKPPPVDCGARSRAGDTWTGSGRTWPPSQKLHCKKEKNDGFEMGKKMREQEIG